MTSAGSSRNILDKNREGHVRGRNAKYLIRSAVAALDLNFVHMITTSCSQRNAAAFYCTLTLLHHGQSTRFFAPQAKPSSGPLWTRLLARVALLHRSGACRDGVTESLLDFEYARAGRASGRMKAEFSEKEPRLDSCTYAISLRPLISTWNPRIRIFRLEGGAAALLKFLPH